MTQPTALRLADALEGHNKAVEQSNGRLAFVLLTPEETMLAAAELRRLHAQRDALLEALKMLVLATKDFSVGRYNEEVHDIALSKARAAIKQAEEKV